jgi:hypothetical protein
MRSHNQESGLVIWRHVGEHGGDISLAEMRADEHVSAASEAGPAEDETAATESDDTVLAREIWNSLPTAIRQYVRTYGALLHRSGAAVLVDKGTRPGGSYAMYSPTMDFCDRDIHQWVRHCEKTYAALVVLTGPGDFAPSTEPVPATSSVLVLGSVRGHDFRDKREAIRWVLRVPVLESRFPSYPHDSIILNENEVAESLSNLPRMP